MRPQLLINKRGLRMRTRRFRAAGVAVMLVAGLTVAAVSSAAAGGIVSGGGGGRAVLRDTGNPVMPGLAAGPAAAPRPPLPRDSTVVLPTGDRVRLDAAGNGAQQATPVPTTVHGRLRSASTFMRFTWGGDQYVIPDQAVPYLHSSLDPRLFDVSYLARARLGTGSTGIPVRITYTSPAATTSLPGVRVTRRSGGTATATITPGQATRLGQFLSGQWRAANAHHSPAPAGQLPGIKRIILAPPPGGAPLPASPAQAPARTAVAGGLPFYTITLNATDLDGNPGTFAGFVQNVDNAALFNQASPSPYFLLGSPATGSESLSVPKGTYSVAMNVVTPDPSGTGFDTALVVKPQVTVDSNTTVSLDARTAVPYQAAPATPVNAPERTDVLSVWRTSVTGGGNGAIGVYPASLALGLYSFSPNPAPGVIPDRLLATPTAPVTEGSFMFDASTEIGGQDSPASEPSYVLDFPYLGSIPSSLTYTVKSADMTTVRSRLYQAPYCTGEALTTDVYLPLGNGQWAESYGFYADDLEFSAAAAPGERTDYWYSSDPRLDLWQHSAGDCSGNDITGPIQPIAPGQQINSGTWLKPPFVPVPDAPPYLYSPFAGDATYSGDPRQPTVCTACRQGDIGTVNVLPLGDSYPAHHSAPDWHFYSNPALRFYRDGTLAIDSANQGQGIVAEHFPFGAELPLLHQAASYELDWTETTPNIDTSNPATVETDWRFRSSLDDPSASLPITETCAPDATQPCSFLPLLFLRYDLALNGDDQAIAGTPEQISFTVTGQQNAPAPSGLSATVSASFDGGQTWSTPQNATSLGNGQFTAAIGQPPLSATDGFVSLRVTAQDGSGNSVTQTIIHAYPLTS